MSASTFEDPELALLAEHLPAFEIEGLIAGGGSGSVYKARQRSLDRDVAIKVLRPERGAEAEFRESFIREARAMARLKHPNLIGVYDSGEAGGMPFLVMEYVHGKSLFRSAHKTQIEPRQAVEIVRGVCEGLAHAHANGIIHRDLRPASILLTPRAEPKIGDFGLARPGACAGAAGYLAPELEGGAGRASEASDLFAVGVILYELLAGHLPVADGIEPPSRWCGCDESLDAICLKAMAADPAGRYGSAREMSAALDQWLRRAVPVVRPQEEPAADAAPVRPVAKVGFNWVLLRNLVVIVVLLVLIHWTWKFTQMQKAWAAEEQVRKSQKPAAAAVLRPAEASAEVAVVLPEPMAVPEVDHDPEPEMPMEALERLRGVLAAGGRSEFPVGTVAVDGGWVFPVQEEMAWYEAAAFAEAHGGRLSARLQVEADQAVLSAPRWLGVYRSGQAGWLRVFDGAAWDGPAPEGEGVFLSAGPAGGLVATDGGDRRLPFAIEWGTVLGGGGLRQILERAASSLAGSEPAFPPGTIEREGDHYLVLRWPVEADEAVRLAELAGGHLAVLSDEEEAAFIDALLGEDAAETGFWIGAERSGRQWKWVTGERWDEAAWAPGFPLRGGGDVAVLVPGAGWKDVPASTRADGLIIEWNAVRMAGSPAALALAEALEAQAELETRAKGLIDGLEAELQKGLADNARDMTWALDSWLRTMSTNEGNRWRPSVEQLKAIVVGNRVPEEVGPEHAIQLSGPMRAVQERCAAKQQALDAEFMTKVRGIHQSFLARAAELAEVDGMHPAVVKALAAEREAAAELERWLAKLKGEELAEVGVAAELPLKIVRATYGRVEDFVDVTERLRELIDLGEEFIPSPEILGDDPAPGRRKQLRVEYEWEGVPRQRMWNDRTEVKIEDFGVE
jgi:tRNA A-37 threonylcarbamoyl transferase component Bud32